jgi:hypothetical protein
MGNEVQGRQLTALAVSATTHCLLGCAIGEVLGMVLATAWRLSDTASILLAVVLAFFFGYSLTVGPVLRSGVALRRAVGVALGVLLAYPGALEAGLGDALFWWSLVLSLAVAFVVTVPVNRALIARGRGHAVAHSAHADGSHAEHGQHHH